MPLADLAKLDRVLVVGSFLRKDHPLIAQRLRQAAKRGTQIHVLHSVDDDWLMKIASRKIVPPSEILSGLESFREILKAGKNAAVLLGNFAQQHPQAAAIHAAAQAMGVKVVRADNGQVPGWGSSFIRWIIPTVAGFVCSLLTLLVYISPFFDGTHRNQGWHDKAASTFVIRTR